MAYIIFSTVSLALLVGFFALSEYETKHSIRFLARERALFDEKVSRVEFVLTHVDFASFIRDVTVSTAHRIAHSTVHFSLLVVRTVERFLTRIVFSLRTRHSADIAPIENTREFVRTLSDFKGHLEETRPEVPDVLE